MPFPNSPQNNQQEQGSSLFTPKHKPKNSTFKKIILISVAIHLVAFAWFSLTQEEPKKPEPMVVTLLPSSTKTATPKKAAAPAVKKQKTATKPAKKAAKKAVKKVVKKPATKSTPKAATAKKAVAKPALKPLTSLKSRISDSGTLQQSSPKGSETRPEVIVPLEEQTKDTRNAMESFRKVDPTQKAQTTRNKQAGKTSPSTTESAEGEITPLELETGELREITRSRQGDGQEDQIDDQIKGQIKGRALLYKPVPPSLNIKKEVSITLKFTVLTDGTVDQIIPTIKADPRLEAVAMELLRQFRFEQVADSVGTQSGSIRFILHPSP